MKKLLIFNLSIITIVIISAWAIPFIHNEIRTIKYGAEFYDLYKQSNMINGIKSCKVLDYSNLNSKVYYISVYNKSKAGFVFHFEKLDGKWIMSSYACIWSQAGSADSFIWPYFYHSTEGLIIFTAVIFGCFLITLIITFSIHYILNKLKLTNDISI